MGRGGIGGAVIAFLAAFVGSPFLAGLAIVAVGLALGAVSDWFHRKFYYDRAAQVQAPVPNKLLLAANGGVVQYARPDLQARAASK